MVTHEGTPSVKQVLGGKIMNPFLLESEYLRDIHREMFDMAEI